MYGKDFHQWREAQEIIRRIEAEEPEVRDMVKGALGQNVDPWSLLGNISPMSAAQIARTNEAGLFQHRINSLYEQQRAANGFGGIFGNIFR